MVAILDDKPLVVKLIKIFNYNFIIKKHTKKS